MLYLAHLILVVKYIPRALTFYQAANPHWYVSGKGDSTGNNKPRHWLFCGDSRLYLALSEHGENNIRDNSGFQLA